MSRRLIIAILAILIIGVIGGTVVLVINRLRSDQESPITQQPSGNLQEAPTGSQQIIDPTGDDDADGLPNSDEAIWGTNPSNADTDGDGFKDGEEVSVGYNPTIPSPNDKLPPGFEPGREVTPLDTAPTEPVAVDQFFVDNLDLDGPDENITEQYQSQYSEAERTPDTLQAFAVQQPIVTQLPRPAESVINIQPQDTPLVMNEYLAVAGNLTPFSNRTTIANAFNSLFSNGDTSGAEGLATVVRLHQELLLEQQFVPPAAANLHKLLLGYTELLEATYTQMTQYNEDPVRAVVAVRQLEEIDKRYIPLIQQELSRLQTLQSQLANS